MRLQYLLSYLLVLLPLFIFTLTLLFSALNQRMQYTNTAALQQLTYATENIAAIVRRMEDSAAGALSLRTQLVRGENGLITVASPSETANILTSMQEQLPDGISTLLYVQGNTEIYTADGVMPFSAWEEKYATEYDLPMSRMFYSLLSNRKPCLLPLLSSSNLAASMGFAYLTPFPTADNRQAVLVYIIHASVLETQFLNYLGNTPGHICLYSTLGGTGELYARSVGATPAMGLSEALHYPGVGLQEVQHNGHDLIMMRVSEPAQDLHCVMQISYDVFYADVLATQRLFLLLIGLMLVVVLALVLVFGFSMYRPIDDLVEHITGRRRADGLRNNELELIRSAYDHTADEADQLSSYLNELMPVVTQQFVARLVFGKIASREEFDFLCRTADLRFTHPWSAALYIHPACINEDGADCLDRCAVIINRFHPSGVTVVAGDMMSEQALCVVVNFAAEEGQQDMDCMRFALQLNDMFAAEGIPQIQIGVGRAYCDPLKMPESFAEASAAVELASRSAQQVFSYCSQTSASPEGEHFTGVNPLTLTLLSEGLHRGEKTVTIRALKEILQEITDQTSSLVFFRFYCSELLSSIIRQASDQGINLDHQQRDSLIDYKTPAEFTEKATALLNTLCDEVRSRQQAQNDHIRQQVMDYILANYKRFDLSLQTVADELGIRRNQITSVLKEDLGQTFVQYVSFLRLNEFKRLLLETDQAIQTCVTEIGYSDVSNFLRKFKSVEGCTAGQYRTLYRERSDSAEE